MAKKENEIYLGGGANINVKRASIVTVHNNLKLITVNDGGISLDIKIEADFDTIPEQYHEVFLNMISAKYLDSVSFGDNPFSQCVPAPKKKWWQFWKANVNI
ncbi:MAG: hypothetical protein RLZZ196_1363 [Bacteroidota bacterium]|jgi:hypothetical protein